MDSFVYQWGNAVRIVVEVRVPDEDGPLTDPDALEFRLKAAGEVTTFAYLTADEVERVSAGVYALTVPRELIPDDGETYPLLVYSTGPDVAEEVAIVIDRSEFA